jgi:hypothetical protein
MFPRTPPPMPPWPGGSPPVPQQQPVSGPLMQGQPQPQYPTSHLVQRSVRPPVQQPYALGPGTGQPGVGQANEQPAGMQPLYPVQPVQGIPMPCLPDGCRNRRYWP